ncbi:hypothetical protein A2335_00515 [Candidatus Peregrinibacteria bacterium RIFOXYB2_FULL_32_7]|nr:MAG: hypothetical protein A2335_00515 [Candidatus Peregrinibacteria bacterium RIFOXYB2_FULL_32_7]
MTNFKTETNLDSITNIEDQKLGNSSSPIELALNQEVEIAKESLEEWIDKIKILDSKGEDVDIVMNGLKLKQIAKEIKGILKRNFDKNISDVEDIKITVGTGYINIQISLNNGEKIEYQTKTSGKSIKANISDVMTSFSYAATKNPRLFLK